MHKTILKLEETLLDSSTRSDADAIANLMAPSFFEHCSSGVLYKYSHGDVFSADPTIAWRIEDFKTQGIGDDACLATYKAIRVNLTSKEESFSLRCSIWKRDELGWKVVFHQGTPCNE